MTWWAEEQRPGEAVTPGTKARQRWEQLRRDAREIEPATPQPGDQLAVRWPMSGWQLWRRVDAVWCEWVADAADRATCQALLRAVRVRE